MSRCPDCTRAAKRVADAARDLSHCARRVAAYAQKHGQPTERQYADLRDFRAAKAAAVNAHDDHVGNCEGVRR